MSQAGEDQSGAVLRSTLAQELAEDESFRDFFDRDFDASRYANNIIQGSTIAASLHKLSDGISQLEAEIHSQVATHHQDLLTQATSIEKLDGVLSMVSNHVEALEASAQRIREKIAQPYVRISSRAAQLHRLQNACELLRRTQRYVMLAKRLKEQVRGGSRELAKAAHTLHDLQAILSDMDLTGVDAVDAERAWIFQAHEGVVKQAQQMLAQGLASGNQSHIATALQVFRNLDTMQVEVSAVIDQARKSIEKDLAHMANVKQQRDKPDGSQDVLTSGLRATVWTRMETLMGSILSTCTQVHHMHRVLDKKRDGLTHQRLMEFVPEDMRAAGVSQAYWGTVTRILKDGFDALVRDVPNIRKVLEGEYPKLLNMSNELWAKVATLYAGEQPSVLAAQEAALRDCLSSFEGAYLLACVHRMHDPVNLVFPENGQQPPSADEVLAISKTILKELEIASLDERLAVAVARNVANTVKLYAVRSEGMQATDSSATAVHGHCSDSLRRNISLVNRMYQFCNDVRNTLQDPKRKYPGEAVVIIEHAVSEAAQFMEAVLAPLFSSIQTYFESYLDDMHMELTKGFKEGLMREPDRPCSIYILNLQEAVSNVHSEVVSRLTCANVLRPRVVALLNSLLSLFVRHACIVEVLDEQRQMRLTADMAQFEMSLETLQNAAGCKIADLGAPYKALRALRPLLFQEAGQIAASPTINQSIPLSVVLHHMFSRVSGVIKSPREVRGMGPRDYARWLVTAPERDSVAAAAAALQVYASEVTARGDRHFHTLYPLLQGMIAAHASP